MERSKCSAKLPGNVGRSFQNLIRFPVEAYRANNSLQLKPFLRVDCRFKVGSRKNGTSRIVQNFGRYGAKQHLPERTIAMCGHDDHPPFALTAVGDYALSR